MEHRDALTRPPRLRAPKGSRVVSRADFQRAYGEGLRVRGATLVLVLVANGLERSRLGLSVGKSVWKLAVQRNRVRRVFREAFRLAQHDLPRGFDVIAIPAQPKLEPELARTRAEFVSLLRKGAERWRATTAEQRAAQREARRAAHEARRAKPASKAPKGKRAKRSRGPG